MDIQHLENASQIVKTWPKWKQNLLKGYSGMTQSIVYKLEYRGNWVPLSFLEVGERFTMEEESDHAKSVYIKSEPPNEEDQNSLYGICGNRIRKFPPNQKVWKDFYKEPKHHRIQDLSLGDYFYNIHTREIGRIVNFDIPRRQVVCLFFDQVNPIAYDNRVILLNIDSVLIQVRVLIT